MSYTYATFTTNLALEMGDPQLTGDPNFQTIVDGTIIPNAEARICSDLDFLGAVVTSTTLLTAGNRNLNWSNAFFVVQSLSVITVALRAEVASIINVAISNSCQLRFFMAGSRERFGLL